MTSIPLEPSVQTEFRSNALHNSLVLDTQSKSVSIKRLSSFSKRPKRLATKPSARA